MSIEVKYCLDKLKAAIADYNIKDAENYTQMLEHWIRQGDIKGA